MRLRNIAALSASLAGGCQAAEAKSPAADNKPNVVIILADDMCYNDLATYGSQNTDTPNIDALAAEGIKFNNCFQAAPMSSPTRHSLYTGLYPVHSGAYPNHTFVDEGTECFVQYFGNEGYKTVLYGKEHISPKSTFAYDYLGNYEHGKYDFSKIDNYLSKVGEQPFFMVVASNESHGPYDCGNPNKWSLDELVLPEYFVDTPSTRQVYRDYLAEVEVFDREVGEIRQILEKNNKSDNTLIVLLTEQGNSFPFSKWTCYSQGLRSGMIVHYPNMVEAGRESDALVEYVDVLPTTLDVAGISRRGKSLDGESFKKVLEGKKSEHKDEVFGVLCSTGVNTGPQYWGSRTVADKKYRYILNLQPEVEYYNPITGAKWFKEWIAAGKKGDEFAAKQASRYQNRPAVEFYDMESDPFEMENLANDPQYKKRMEKMAKSLEKWMESQGDKGIQTEIDGVKRLMPYAAKKFNEKYGK